MAEERCDGELLLSAIRIRRPSSFVAAAVANDDDDDDSPCRPNQSVCWSPTAYPSCKGQGVSEVEYDDPEGKWLGQLS